MRNFELQKNSGSKLLYKNIIYLIYFTISFNFDPIKD